MDALFRKIGIYSHPGQLYEPVDSDKLLYYREASDGQILEEGITEAGCMGSFVAAGTAYANHGVSMLPFWTFYSMFGMQRVGDLVWAAADSRARGFMMGATAGRTTLAGEGLQHQDGNSLLLAMTVPNLLAYDPAYAYELATIIQDGIKRMYHDDESVFYYITLMNENYPHPPMPEGARDGILKGLHCVQPSEGEPDIHLIGGGTILGEVLQAADALKARFNLNIKIWSATSYGQLYRNACETDRWNRLHPDQPARTSHVGTCLADGKPVVIASDYVRALAHSVAPWVPGALTTLGTDGFGRSDGRPALRRFFEVDAAHIQAAAAAALATHGRIDATEAIELQQALGIDPELPPPATR
jgi:pyruvate dehydrogenase E1 component